ncbi:E3 ubiquitin-protein ligase DZIP3-like isoform X2 [Xenia sp. Carnegie-2017]|uniref:E3 ubiquitin-protein ligase DZIP3-like isoform X2 n=1 Tax=Xenia sp. Carnegie-2017 TaxID=2897299 RepID=UPI001F042AB5|nr:E3 ubiquitin-protein ligase DZIP3-like isoform X2 [Xenia sp. Carnegie-2017]
MALHSDDLKMEANGSRLNKLIINKGTQALRETLQSLIKPSNLRATLNDPRTKRKLTSLKRKVISSGDWDLLYPATGSPDVENFTITLLFILLRNLCGLNPPATGWNAFPPSSDFSISSDIVRIRFYRNIVMGHITTTSLDDSEFEGLWKEISRALVGLGIQQAEIDELKYAPLSPHEAYYREMLKDLQTKHELDLPDDNSSNKLTPEEIEKVSQKVATRWNRLSLLLQIPSVQLKEISSNHVKYPDPSAKSKKILEIFNEQTNFDRLILNNCLKKIQLDLDKILSPPKQILHEIEARSSRIYQGTSEARSKTHAFLLTNHK